MGWNVHKIFYVTFFYNEQVETTWSRERSTLIIYYKLWMYSRIFICTIKKVKLKSIRDNIRKISPGKHGRINMIFWNRKQL